MKLSQPELRFDPHIRRFRYLRPTSIDLPGFVGLHFPEELNHLLKLFYAMNGTTGFLVAGTALPFGYTVLAICRLCAVLVHDL